MRPLVFESLILDSPSIVPASTVLAQSVTLASVEGMIWPRTASTRLVWRMASSKLPTTPDMATMNRLPKEWPASPEPSEKRYWKRLVTRGSASARAAMQLRTSPGGGMPSSRRGAPERAPVAAGKRGGRPGAPADGDDLRAALKRPLVVDHVDDALAAVAAGHDGGHD